MPFSLKTPDGDKMNTAERNDFFNQPDEQVLIFIFAQNSNTNPTECTKEKKS